jgi:predicted RNA-binding Zn ribbon-like protein
MSTVPVNQPKPDIKFIGGALCLDFANTIHDYAGPDPQEELNRFDDLVNWSQLARIINANDARRFLRAAGKNPVAAKRTLRQAKELRSALYAIFRAVTQKQGINKKEFDLVLGFLSEAVKHLTIGHDRGAVYSLSWNKGLGSELILYEVVQSAAGLLATVSDQRLRQCSGKQCTWLFIDSSKNGSRRWCEMQRCGSREKSRRYYHKKQKRK